MMVWTVLQLFVSLLSFGIAKVEYDLPPQFMDHFHLPNLIGKWYEVFSSRLPSNATLADQEKYCVLYEFCSVNKAITSSGNKNSRSSIIAYEVQREGGYKGDIIVSHFHMHSQQAKTHSGRWLVRSSQASHQLKHLRVVGAYPEHSSHGQYHWVAISTPLAIDVLVLARDVTEFHTIYASYVEKWLASQGFKYSFNMPRMTKHDHHACQYDEMWRKKEMSYGVEDNKSPRLLDMFTSFPDNM